MTTPVRDFYINMLEKRAEETNPAQWSASTDDQQIANAELNANVKDQRAQLKPMFEQAAAAETADTKLVGKLLPQAKRSPEAASSNPLLKVAAHQAFFDGLRQTDLMKAASPDYVRAAYLGFESELDKIASLLAGVGKSPAVTNFLKRVGGGVGKGATKAVPKAKAALPAASAPIRQVGGGRGAGVWQLG